MTDIARLAQMGSLKKYPADEYVFYEGDPGREMYIILQGKVEISLSNIDGSHMAVAKLGPGEFFGEMSLLEGLPRSANVQAVEDTILILLNQNNFEVIMVEQPLLVFGIMKGLSSRLRLLNTEMKSARSGGGGGGGGENAGFQASLLQMDLVPEGHKSYPGKAEETHAQFLADKKVTCPVCDGTFDTFMIRSSRLRLQTIDPDFRQRFSDFEPMWYNIWVCPKCYYANFNFEYNQIPDSAKKKILAEGKELKSKINFAYSNPREIDQVFLAYYLALHACQKAMPDPVRLAKIWLRLAWLYDDVKDEEMCMMASKQALEHYKEAYFNGRRDSTPEQDQRLTLMLAELSLKTGDAVEALTHFRNSIVRNGGSPVLNKQAQDRLDDLKHTVMAEQ